MRTHQERVNIIVEHFNMTNKDPTLNHEFRVNEVLNVWQMSEIDREKYIDGLENYIIRIKQQKDSTLFSEIEKIQNDLIEFILNDNDKVFSISTKPLNQSKNSLRTRLEHQSKDRQIYREESLNDSLMSRISHLHHDPLFVKQEFDKLINFKRNLVKRKIYSILPSTFFNSSKNAPDTEDLKYFFSVYFKFVLTLTDAYDIFKFSWKYYLSDLFDLRIDKNSSFIKIEIFDYFNRNYGGILNDISSSKSLIKEELRFQQFQFKNYWIRYIKNIEKLNDEFEVRKCLFKLLKNQKEWEDLNRKEEGRSWQHKIFNSLNIKIQSEIINKKNEKLYEMYEQLILLGILSN